MKKLISLLLAVCVCLFIGVIFTSCDSSEEHSHTYKTERSKDEQYHWFACEDEHCTKVLSKSAHVWDAGEITTQPSTEANGIKTFTCTVCGQTKTETVSFTGENNTQGGNDEDDESSGNTQTEQFSLTFDANGGAFSNGDRILTQTVTNNSKATSPQAPTRIGYSFGGWSIEQNNGELWDFANECITENTTLYATWTPLTASIVSFENAKIDGTQIFLLVDEQTQSVSLSNMIICSENSKWHLYRDQQGQTEIPTKIASGTNGSLLNGENVFYIVVTSIDETVSNVYELTVYRSYAVPINYYHGETLINTQTAYTGTEFTITYEADIEGCSFNHWTDQSGVHITRVTPWGAVNLYASTEALKYQIIYDANGGTVERRGETLTYNQNYTLLVPERYGYTFTGWYHQGSVCLTDTNGNSIEPWTFTRDITVKAGWQKNTHNVTLSINDTAAGIVSGEGVYYCGQTVTVNAMTNIGYAFLGWYNGETKLSEETSYTFTLADEAVSLTAKYEMLPEFTPFIFTSTATTCTVTGLKDKNELIAVIPDSVTDIEWNAYGFDEYDKLTSITIPASVKRINNDAFRYCRKLVEIINRSELSIPLGNGYYVIEVHSEDSKIINQDDFLFYTYNGTNYLVGYVGRNTVLTLPESYNGAPYEIYSHALYKHADITSVTVPSNVTGIGFSAFYGCTSLECITIPFIGNGSNYTNFGYIFHSPTAAYLTSNDGVPSSLKTVVITGGESIGRGAFNSCSNLESITICSSIKNIYDEAFMGCFALERIIFAEGCGIEISGPRVFDHCNSLTGVHISNVADWCEFKFSSNASNPLNSAKNLYLNDTLLTELVIPTDVTHIGQYAFINCTALTSITVPSTVTDIGINAFFGCTEIEKIYFYADAMEDLNGSYNVFYNAGADGDGIEVVIGKAVTKIPAYLFYCSSDSYAPKILSIVFEEDSVCESIGNWAFYHCTELASLEIPTNVTSIGGMAFYCCTGLKTIEIPCGVKIIGGGAFGSCTGLVSVTIGNGVTSIGDASFADCTALEKIYFNADNIPDLSLDNNVFYNAGTKGGGIEIAIGANVTKIPAYLFYPRLSSTMGYTPPKITNVVFLQGSVCASIGDCAFRDCEKLTYLNIPSSVADIGYGAFYDCVKLKSVTLPESVLTVGEYAFYNCESITEITIPASVTSIGKDSFGDCTGLINVIFPEGSKLTAIGNFAFLGCTSLTKITVPASVTSIGIQAFSSCPNLTSVAFENTSGWFIYNSETSDVSIDVSNPTTAATHITSTYRSYHWRRQ